MPEASPQETLGRTLRAARQSQGFSTSQVAAATRIKIQTIEALEADDFSRIAAPIYGKGFIKLYAEHLGLEPTPLIHEYLRGIGAVPPHTSQGEHISALTRVSENIEERESARPIRKVLARLGLPALADVLARYTSRAILRSPTGLATGAAVVVLLILIAATVRNCRQANQTSGPAPPARRAPERIIQPPPDPYL